MGDSQPTPMRLMLVPMQMRSEIRGRSMSDVPRLISEEVSPETEFCTDRCGLRRIGPSFDSPVIMWHDLEGHEKNAVGSIVERGHDLEPVPGLVLVRERIEVYADGARVMATPTEWRILLALGMNAGKTMTHGRIGYAVWGEQYLDSPSMLRVNVARLRQKLTPSEYHAGMTSAERTRASLEHRFIRTVPSFGYIMG